MLGNLVQRENVLFHRGMKRREQRAVMKVQRVVQEALLEWQDAQRYFESVCDPQLVRFAIHKMEAARRKYLFLLKNAHRIE